MKITDNLTSIKYNLYNLMANNGISKTELAKRTGISYFSIRNYLIGDSIPTVENLIILAKTFDVSLDFLVGGLGNNEDQDTFVRQTDSGLKIYRRPNGEVYVRRE